MARGVPLRVGLVVAAWLAVGAATPSPVLAQRGTSPLPFQFTHEVVGRKGGRLVVALRLEVEARDLGRTTVGGVEVAQVAVRGEVSREQGSLETFEYSFTVPWEGEHIPLLLERQLRPGEYQLRLELQDLTTGRKGEVRASLPVTVPGHLLSSPAHPVQPDSPPRRKVVLVAPEGDALAGLQEFTAVTVGEVARVQFLLDQIPVLTRNRPPFRAHIDLGPLPRRVTVTAVAQNAEGEELDRAELVLNQGRELFAVRLEPVTPADRRGDQVLLRAAVSTPSERRVERVDFFLGEARVAQIATPPFQVWVPAGDEAVFVRVVATLDDGAQAEDLAPFGTARFIGGVRVDAVELPVTVLGRDDKPVEGLELGDFEVWEDGVTQRLTHLARHGDGPVRVGLVLDTSGSMEPTLGEVQRVALGFLRRLLRPTDRAFVVAFSDRPALLQPMTRDFEALGRSLLGLRAHGVTAMYDAVVFALLQLSGVRGRRAVVVLTDGADNSSRHTSEHVVELAGRVGATVYTIGVDLSVGELRARAGLARLASATGGEAFFVARGGDLERVYQRIERELRSQYLVVYTSSSDAPPGQWRRVEVRVRRPGVKVRTLPGYVPH